MALSRRDVGREGRRKNSDGTFSETEAQYEARWDGYETDRQMHLYSDDRREEGPARAFFHPGVGLWQLDDAGDPDDGWVELNHGQRADTGLGANGEFDTSTRGGPADSGGEVVAKLLSDEYCGGTNEADRVDKARQVMRQWHACKPAECIAVYNSVYLDRSDDLYVTISRDEGLYSTTGGVSQHQCRWSNSRLEDPIVCFFYDTDHPQGWTDTAIPSTTARPPLTGELGSSPYALPFVAFTDDGKRFAVFPDKILYPTPDSVDSTRYKAVPEDKNARKQANTWSTDAYDSATLEMRICGERDWVIAGTDRCKNWVSIDEVGPGSLR